MTDDRGTDGDEKDSVTHGAERNDGPGGRRSSVAPATTAGVQAADVAVAVTIDDGVDGDVEAAFGQLLE